MKPVSHSSVHQNNSNYLPESYLSLATRSQVTCDKGLGTCIKWYIEWFDKIIWCPLQYGILMDFKSGGVRGKHVVGTSNKFLRSNRLPVHATNKLYDHQTWKENWRIPVHIKTLCIMNEYFYCQIKVHCGLQKFIIQQEQQTHHKELPH